MVQSNLSPLGTAQRELRQLARRAGVGKALQRYRTLRSTGIRALVRTAYFQRTLLPRILDARPIASDRGLEVHMLLNHPRVLEGSWSLYSLAHFMKTPCRFVIHDDGSLDGDDVGKLRHLFPGVRIIDRKEADAYVLGELAKRGLTRCSSLRKNFILSLKLFDPYFYAASDYFVSLDSDILTYRAPRQIEEHASRNELFFSEDNGYRSCLSEAEYEQLAGMPLTVNCNSGLFGARKDAVDLGLIETWLDRPSFWHTPYEKATHYTEQAVWSLLFARGGATSLDSGYGISLTDLDAQSTITGHYCGGGYWSSLFYWRALPYLAQQLSKAGALPA